MLINVFGHLIFPLFKTDLLSIYYVPAIVLGIKDTAVTLTLAEKIPGLVEHRVKWDWGGRKRINK